MAIPIESLAEFGPAQAAHMADVRAAQGSGDEVALAKANAAWAEKRLELMGVASEREEQSRAIEAAKIEARQNFPNAPEAIYDALTDPAAITAAAKAAHEHIEARLGVAAAAPAAGAGATPSWGGAPAAGGSTSATPGSTDPDLEFQARLPELEREVRKGRAGDPEKVKEFLNTWADRQISSRFNPNSVWHNHTFPGPRTQ